MKKRMLKKRMLKKSDVLREGYVKGLREGLNVINKMLAESASENADSMTKYVTAWTEKIVDAIKEEQDDINTWLKAQWEDFKSRAHLSLVYYCIQVNCDDSSSHWSAKVRNSDFTHIGLPSDTNTDDWRIHVRVNDAVYIYFSANVLIKSDFTLDIEEYAKAIKIGLKNQAKDGQIIAPHTWKKFKIDSEYEDEVANVNARNDQRMADHKKQGFFKRTFGKKPELEQAPDKESFIRGRMREGRRK